MAPLGAAEWRAEFAFEAVNNLFLFRLKKPRRGVCRSVVLSDRGKMDGHLTDPETAFVGWNGAKRQLLG